MEKNELYHYCEKVNIKGMCCNNCPSAIKCWCERGEYIKTNKITIKEQLIAIQKFEEKLQENIMTNP